MGPGLAFSVFLAMVRLGCLSSTSPSHLSTHFGRCTLLYSRVASGTQSINQSINQSIKLHLLDKADNCATCTLLQQFTSIQFIDHLYSPPLSKVHYGGGLCTALAKSKAG